MATEKQSISGPQPDHRGKSFLFNYRKMVMVMADIVVYGIQRMVEALYSGHSTVQN
jgi:hypothetical protein